MKKGMTIVGIVLSVLIIGVIISSEVRSSSGFSVLHGGYGPFGLYCRLRGWELMQNTRGPLYTRDTHDICVKNFSDAGKLCVNSDECQGYCIQTNFDFSNWREDYECTKEENGSRNTVCELPSLQAIKSGVCEKRASGPCDFVAERLDSSKVLIHPGDNCLAI